MVAITASTHLTLILPFLTSFESLFAVSEYSSPSYSMSTEYDLNSPFSLVVGIIRPVRSPPSLCAVPKSIVLPSKGRYDWLDKHFVGNIAPLPLFLAMVRWLSDHSLLQLIVVCFSLGGLFVQNHKFFLSSVVKSINDSLIYRVSL